MEDVFKNIMRCIDGKVLFGMGWVQKIFLIAGFDHIAGSGSKGGDLYASIPESNLCDIFFDFLP